MEARRRDTVAIEQRQRGIASVARVRKRFGRRSARRKEKADEDEFDEHGQ